MLQILIGFFSVSAAGAELQRITISSLSDSGPGTFRNAIVEANRLPDTNHISFNIGSGVQRFCPHTPLPEVTSPIIIDGTTQPGFFESPLIELDGICAGAGSGIVIAARSSIVRGLIIHSWSEYGVLIKNTEAIGVFGSYIGVGADGASPKPNGATKGLKSGAAAGVGVISSNNSVIGGASALDRNVISGNVGYGIKINLGSENTVSGNLIGTDLTGMKAVPNSRSGVWILRSARNVIGGEDTDQMNLISGNIQYGVGISGSESTQNLIINNYIGTDLNGNVAVPNERTGVLVFNAPGNAISRNVIAGNARAGINIDGSKFGNPPAWDSGAGNARNNTVVANKIGVNSHGTAAVPNGLVGIRLFNSQASQIGGEIYQEGNIISGNLREGILVQSDPERDDYHEIARNNIIEGNLIGTDITAYHPIPNKAGGIRIRGEGNRVGGDTAGTRNVIRFNEGFDLRLMDQDAHTNATSDHNELSSTLRN